MSYIIKSPEELKDTFYASVFFKDFAKKQEKALNICPYFEWQKIILTIMKRLSMLIHLPCDYFGKGYIDEKCHRTLAALVV